MDIHQVFEHDAAHFASDHKEGDEFKLGLLGELARDGDSLLDVACGNGYFTDKVLAETKVKWACALEFSNAMLALNKMVPNKSLVRASVFDMPFKSATFTFVHGDAVLHHLVGTTREASVQKAYQGFKSLVNQVAENGFVILSECCVEGYLGGSFSSAFIFYALKFFSRTWLARLFKIPRGLLVCFLTPDELLRVIEGAGGHIIKMEVTHNKPPFLFRLALCKDHPNIHILISKDPRAASPNQRKRILPEFIDF